MSTQRRLLVVWGSAALLLTGTVAAAPSASPTTPAATPAVTPAATPPVASPAAPVSVPAARNKLEGGMTELGSLLMRARQSGDGVRIACVQDKNDRAEIVLEVATGEILVLQDPATDGQSRAFAGEKLSEAADRLSGLVSQARACQGNQEDASKANNNEANQPKTVIPNDPTSTVPTGPRLPPRIDPRPPVASPVL